MAKDVLLFGPPGAGKGTQAAALSRACGLPHIATGDMFRKHLADGTPLGLRARDYMDRGELVPDEITIGMLAERLREIDARNGFLLDGFPRTEPQAAALDSLLAADDRRVSGVLDLEVGEEELVRRLSGRLVCRAQGHNYHETEAPPRTAGICDVDGSELYRRPDDEEPTVRRRVRVFFEQTQPLLAYYRAAGVPVFEIDGARDRAAVEADLLAAVRSLP